MTLQDVIDASRYRLNNYEKPYFWTDAELVIYANEAITQVCRDGRILEDSMTGSICNIPTVANQLDYALNALIIYIRSVRLVVTEKMTLDVAPATPWSVGDTLTGATSHKTCSVVANYLTDSVNCPSSLYYTVENRTGEFTLGEVISNGTVTADQGATRPVFADNSTESRFLKKFTKYQMDTTQGWRTDTADKPVAYIVDYNAGYLTLDRPPDAVYTLNMSVIRFPSAAFSATAMSSQTPEIPAQWHFSLVDGIVYQAYLKKGQNTYDPKKSADHYALFRKSIATMKAQTNLFEANEMTAGPRRGFI